MKYALLESYCFNIEYFGKKQQSELPSGLLFFIFFDHSDWKLTLCPRFRRFQHTN